MTCDGKENMLKYPKEVNIMKDIPMFTTEYGVASLVLKEVPYRQEAYIRVRDVQPGQLRELLGECISFCRMVGAERVYATGHDELENSAYYGSVIQMRGEIQVDGSLVENLFPVTEQTVSRWREICNDRLRDVDFAATLTAADESMILSSGGAYFIHRQGELLGAGWLEDGKLLLLCAVLPGAGERVMHTLLSLTDGAPLELEVASTNLRAIRLYERLGLIRTKEITKWYKIF